MSRRGEFNRPLVWCCWQRPGEWRQEHSQSWLQDVDQPLQVPPHTTSWTCSWTPPWHSRSTWLRSSQVDRLAAQSCRRLDRSEWPGKPEVWSWGYSASPVQPHHTVLSDQIISNWRCANKTYLSGYRPTPGTSRSSCLPPERVPIRRTCLATDPHLALGDRHVYHLNVCR